MKGWTLSLFVAVGIGIAAYAVWTLARPRGDTVASRAEPPEASPPRPPRRDPPPVRTSPAPARPVPSAPASAAAAPTPEPTPPREAPVTERAEELRHDIADLLERLDDQIRNEVIIPSEARLEFYTRGSADISALAAELGARDGAADEIKGYHEDLRAKIKALETLDHQAQNAPDAD